jgi:glycine/D-amino acid oxidase-like deaminating enzyme
MLYLRKPHIAQFEVDTYNMLRDLVSENAIPCDWKTVGGVQAITSQATLDLARERLAQLEASHPELARQLRLVTERSELEEGLRLGPEAVGAVVQDCAASCWPYKLVSWILETLLSGNQDGEREKEKEASSSGRRGKLNLQTGTSALHLQRSGDVWIVHTDRGQQIAARDVILATNAYTSHLLPKFTGLITPVRGQVAALIEPDGVAPISPFDNSYVWQVREDGDPAESDNYLIYRDSGEFILGGERHATTEAGWATTNDDVVDPILSRRLHAGLGKALTGIPPEMKSSHEWTGIMGYSADDNPWVGRVPEGLGGDTGGLWVTAGYTGHGMPVAARCGIAVSEMVLGKSGQGTVKLPPEWIASEERASIARATTLPETFEDELRSIVQECRKA